MFGVEIEDKWTVREIAIFEAGICAYGKEFHTIAKLFKIPNSEKLSKTCNEVVEFYYVWKKSAHYDLWKENGRLVKSPADGKQDVYKVIDSKMKTFE